MKVPIATNSVVVAFDICSSSDIIEELTLKGDMKRFQRFLTAIKRYLMEKQKTLTFDTYKFTGDGWILLFPENTEGKVLLKFLKDLCNAVFNDYLAPAKNFRIFEVKRTLRNIRGGVAFRCRKIELLPSSSTS